MRGSSPGSPSGNPGRSSPVNGVSRGFGSGYRFPSCRSPSMPGTIHGHRPAPRRTGTSPRRRLRLHAAPDPARSNHQDTHPAAPGRHTGRGPFLYVQTDEFVLSTKRHSEPVGSFRQTIYGMKDSFAQPMAGILNHSGTNHYDIYKYHAKSVCFIDCLPYRGSESRGVYDEFQE